MATITYCDVPLLIPGDDVLDWIQRRYPVGNLYSPPIDFSPKLAHMPRSGPYINCLYWPRGATRWAEFFGLADKDRMEDIMQEAQSRRASGESPILKIRHENRYGGETYDAELRVEMYMNVPRPLTLDDGNRLFLIPLVDQRYIWRFMSTGELDIDQGDSWSTLFDHFRLTVIPSKWGSSRMSYTTPSADYLDPDPGTFTQQHADLCHLLDLAAVSVGGRIVCRIGGGVEMQTFSEAQSLRDSNINDALKGGFDKTAVLSGDDYTNAPGWDDKWFVPAAVEVSFPRICQYVPNIDGDRYSYEIDSNDAAIACPLDPAYYEVEPNTKKRIWSTAYADFSGGGATPDNDTALQTLAEKIASDYYCSFDKQYRYRFAGLTEWQPTAYDYCVMWRICQGEVSTEVMTEPENLDIEYMAHQQDQTIFDPRDTLKRGITEDTIEPCEKGTVSIYEGCPTGSFGGYCIGYDDTGIDVEAANGWMNCGERVSTGKHVTVKFFWDSCCWEIMDRCPEDS